MLNSISSYTTRPMASQPSMAPAVREGGAFTKTATALAAAVVLNLAGCVETPVKEGGLRVLNGAGADTFTLMHAAANSSDLSKPHFFKAAGSAPFPLGEAPLNARPTDDAIKECAAKDAVPPNEKAQVCRTLELLCANNGANIDKAPAAEREKARGMCKVYDANIPGS